MSLICARRPDFLPTINPYFTLATRAIYLGAGLTALGILGSISSRSRIELKNLSGKVKNSFCSAFQKISDKRVYQPIFDKLALFGAGFTLLAVFSRFFIPRHPVNFQPPGPIRPPNCL